MGDASPSRKEYILCLLPFPEDHKITSGIKEKHPDVEIDYHHVLYVQGQKPDISKVAKGMSTQL